MATKGVELASAYISLSVETSQVPSQVRKALDGTTKFGDNAGRDLGKRMASALSGEVGRAGRESGEQFGSGFRRETSDVGRRTASSMHGDLVQGAGSSGRTAGKRFASSFSSAADKVKVNVSGVAADSGRGAAESFAGGFAGASALTRLGAVGGPVGVALAGLGAVGFGAGKSLAVALNAGFETIRPLNMVAAQLGADSQMAQRIAGGAGKAYAQNFGQSFEANLVTAREAFFSGLIPRDASEDQIASVVSQLSTVADVLGTDVSQASQAVGKLLKTGMVDNIGQAFDLLTVGSQKGLNQFGDLLDSMTEYSSQFQQLGLSAPEVLGLIEQGMQGAARNTDVVADSLKEIGVRAVDGSKTTADAFAALGLPVEETARKFAEGGQVAHDAFGLVLDRVRAIEDPLIKDRVAADLFGTTVENLGTAFDRLDLDTATEDLGQFKGATDRAADSAANLTSEWDIAGRNISEWLRTLKEDVAEWASTTFDFLPHTLNQLFDFKTPDDLQFKGVPGAPGVPFTPGQTRPPGSGTPSRNPLDVISGAQTPAGGSPREFAHQTMMPYWQKQGFQVGDHEADQYGEHQNGALDIMIPNLAAGQRILQQVLQDPNVYGVIFNGQSYGYGHGMTPKPYSGPNPHTDHVHVWYKPQGMAAGGGVSGAGGPRSDSIPAYLSDGEHVLTAAEVAMMGGQSGVYAFRNALHRNTGGEVDWLKGDRKRTPGWVPRGNFHPNMKIDTSMASSSGAPWYYKMLTEGLGVEPFMTERVGSSWHMGRLLDLISGGAAGYRGDVTKKHPVWPPMRFAQGGAISLDILKRLQESGGLPTGPIPPEAMQSLQAGAQAFNAKQQGFGSEITQAGRTEGYIPAAAGFTGKTGGGLAGGLINMAAEAINGLIDQAAGAASMGANVAAPGSGIAIGMGAQAAKRLVSYGAEMAGIGIGAASEIFLPFGAPRWLSDVDPTSFMPQMGVQPAAVTSGEQAMQNEVAQQQGLRPPPGVQAGADAFRAKAGQPLAGQVGTPLAPHAAGPPPGPGLTPKPADDPFNFLKMFGLFDQGGILQPNSAGLNLSNRPEYVLTPQQWKTMESNAQNGAAGSGGATYYVTAGNVDEAVRELRRKERLAMMQHAGRP